VLHLTTGRRRTAADGLRAVAPLLPEAAFLAILALDAVQFSRSWPVLVTGVLDEPAHLLTAALFLAALAPRGARPLVPWALAGSVLIDVDHVPLYAHWGSVAADGGRPVSHSLATLGVLLVIAALVRPWRRAATGLFVGVVLHFVRDLTTPGPGVPLFAPWSDAGVRAPYGWYAAALAAVTVVATVRWWRERAVSARR
jgi:inner membrane protein